MHVYTVFIFSYINLILFIKNNKILIDSFNIYA